MNITQKSGRTYYKYSKDTPDAHKVGTPVVEDGILSKLGAASYYVVHTIPFSDANSWEIVWKGTTPATFPANSNLFTLDNSKYGFLAYFSKNVMRVHFSTNGTSWDLASNLEVITLETNKLYWFKFEYTGTDYGIYVSYDGVEWEERLRIAKATRLPYTCNDLYIGYRKAYTGEFWTGTIDLNEMYVKINGEIYWKGMRALKSTEEDYDFYKDEYEYTSPDLVTETQSYTQSPWKKVNLYNSTTRSYINTNNHYVVDSVTAWTTSTVYGLGENITANKIRATVFSTFIQANAGWTCTFVAKCKDGSTCHVRKDWGYNVMPRDVLYIEFPTNQTITQIIVYAQCYRKSTKNCYGGINITFDYSEKIKDDKEGIPEHKKYTLIEPHNVYTKPIELAPGMKQLEFIQSNGNQRIITDYIPKMPDTKIRIICEFTNNIAEQCVYCSRGATTTTSTNTLFRLSGGLRFDYNSSTAGQTTACKNNNYVYEIVQDNNILYVNGVAKYTYAESVFNCVEPLSLFMAQHGGLYSNLSYPAHIKCYLLEIYENGEIVRKYIPCERQIDKACGLYDVINDKFFSNFQSDYNFSKGSYVYEQATSDDYQRKGNGITYQSVEA